MHPRRPRDSKSNREEDFKVDIGRSSSKVEVRKSQFRPEIVFPPQLSVFEDAVNAAGVKIKRATFE